MPALAALLGLFSTLLIAQPAQASSFLLSSVNRERAAAGAAPLARMGDLDAVAQAWSEQMARSGKLSHNPNYSSQVGNWRMVAENVGYGPTEDGVHRAFMGSSAHRSNILNGQYTEIGIGVASGRGSVWVTQVFRRPLVASARPAPAAAPAAAPALQRGDRTSDGRPDVLATDGSGKLWLYPGAGSDRFLPRRQVGSGWGGIDLVTSVGDVDGDRTTDLVARNERDGRLWLYLGDGRGGVKSARVIGTGWQGMNGLYGVGDFNGDGWADLLARKSSGELLLYPMVRGTISAARKAGSGWSSMQLVTAVGDFDGDRRPDLVARSKATGALWLYSGNGTGGFARQRVIGTGWKNFDRLVGVGDWNSDGATDLLARTSDGRLLRYAGNGSGGFRGAAQVGRGWQDYTLIS